MCQADSCDTRNECFKKHQQRLAGSRRSVCRSIGSRSPISAHIRPERSITNLALILPISFDQAETASQPARSHCYFGRSTGCRTRSRLRRGSSKQAASFQKGFCRTRQYLDMSNLYKYGHAFIEPVPSITTMTRSMVCNLCGEAAFRYMATGQPAAGSTLLCPTQHPARSSHSCWLLPV